MPQQGLEVTEGTVMTVLVEVGAKVAEGEALMEVETDKAVAEVVAPTEGYVSRLAAAVGDTVPIGAVLLDLVDRPEDVGSEPVAQEPVRTSSTAEPADTAPAPAQSDGPRASAGDGARIKAAPVARRAAEKLGVDLATVTGSGPDGRITLDDVERAAADGSQSTQTSAGDGDGDGDGAERLESMSSMRVAIARRMEASQQIPQYQLDRAIEADWLLGERERLKAEGHRGVTVNDLLVQALAETVLRHPDLGASFVEQGPDGRPGLLRRAGVNVGLAVATDRGLLVPVIADAQRVSLDQCADARRRLVERARDGKLGRDEMTGATITISNLGGFGVDRFTAMLNPGESAILAVGRAVPRLVARDRGIAEVRSLHLTLTLDHRVIDGAVGAAALVELAGLLEGDMTWRS
jgi:pyruvate dehydrogenase E2 component (dihydrolipoamide acetyltransferase)